MTYDAAVVGGSFAGLAAAMVLARASRSVCVIDDEQPRNRFAPSTHGVFALDGVAPRAMIDAARAQLRNILPFASFSTGLLRRQGSKTVSSSSSRGENPSSPRGSC